MEDIDSKFITVKGSNIRYIVRGSGAPVLLIHGFGEFLETWWFNIEQLSEYYEVYAMDLPGHGLSDKPPVNYTLPFATKFICDFMQALGIERAHLIGHSLGAAIDLNMAINSPDRVDKLILIDCGGLSEEVPFLYRLCTLPFLGEVIMKPTVKSSLRSGIKGVFYNPDLVTEEMVDKDYEFLKMPETKRVMLNMIRSNADFSGMHPEVVLTDKLHLVESPALFIHGEQDTVVSLDDVRDACDLMPDARLEVIPECGHCPHIEKPREFNGAAIAFLESNGRDENVR